MMSAAYGADADLHVTLQKHAPKSDEQLYREWIDKYGQGAADIIKKTVDDNVADYEYLKQYAIQIPKKA